MKTIELTFISRLKEIACVFFGHDWNEYGSDLEFEY